MYNSRIILLNLRPIRRGAHRPIKYSRDPNRKSRIRRRTRSRTQRRNRDLTRGFFNRIVLVIRLDDIIKSARYRIWNGEGRSTILNSIAREPVNAARNIIRIRRRRNKGRPLPTVKPDEPKVIIITSLKA